MLALDTFNIAKYPKIVKISSVIFWKTIKIITPELLYVMKVIENGHFKCQ